MVADRNTVLVHAGLLEAPEPIRPRADQGGGLGHLGDLHVLTSENGSGRMSLALVVDQWLTLLGRYAVAVLREQDATVGRDIAEGYHRVTHQCPPLAMPPPGAIILRPR